MSDRHVIDVRVSDIRQLFNSLDPSPFHEKDLDREAEEYIVSWADEVSPRAELELVVHLPRAQIERAVKSDLPRAVLNYFSYRAEASRRRIRSQLREGRWALVIGLAFLFACMLLRQVAGSIEHTAPRQVLQEGLVILGWVAMWRPLQIFLYDWWPVRHHARLYQRLAAMPVRIIPS
jgi:hypothetical protein